MAYAYQRANYGDYYAAGGLFGTLGKIVGGVASVAGKILPGPVGAVAGFAGRALTGSGKPGTAISTRVIPSPGQLPLLSGPQGTQIQTTPYLGLPVHGGGDCPSGFHRNKSDYFLKSGEFVPAGSRCVKNRSLNPGNARAVRRATRRNEAFVGLAKRAMQGTNYKVVGKSYRSNWRKPLKK